tara:strand:+ start:11627 stop:12667 length:1041 start_codon:yes stop_codon:yes gene_type:complete
MSTDNQEIQLKDILLKIKELKNEMLSNSIKIIFFIFLFVFVSLLLVSFQDSKYKAELSFVVEDKQQSAPLSSMSGLASQFGFDLFSASNSTFSQKNIMELLKSRGVVSKALMQKVLISSKSDFFISHYLSIYNLDKDWGSHEDLKELSFNNKLSLKHDSVITLIWEDIIENYLTVEIKNDETDIICLSFICQNAHFAKLFSESLISEMSRMYISHQTKQSSNTIEFLQNRADSVFHELEKAEEDFARVKDINQRIIKASGRLKELQLMRNVEVLNTMYLELVKNLEVSKLTLLKQTPIIQVIDKPILPLKDAKISMSFTAIVSFLFALFISVFYVFLRKLVRDSLD